MLQEIRELIFMIMISLITENTLYKSTTVWVPALGHINTFIEDPDVRVVGDFDEINLAIEISDNFWSQKMQSVSNPIERVTIGYLEFF
jgi:hypothetical protein